MIAIMKYCLYLWSDKTHDMNTKINFFNIAGFRSKDPQGFSHAYLRGFLFGAGLIF